MGATSAITINNEEYNIKNELGQDGFGRVVQVSRKSDNKEYALKIIPIKDEPKERINNSQNEANILSKFNCNNIVKYYDSFKVIIIFIY